MTTRPGNRSLHHLRRNRTMRLCNLITITRRDGYQLRFTDHDRALTFEGNTFEPVNMAAMSAGRVEAAFKTGNQEAYGHIDGTMVTIPDLLGNRYRGAEVQHVVVEWDDLLRVHGRHRRWIRGVNWTGSQWVATLEARSQELQRPAAGRFGGSFSTYCYYTLGDSATCKKDISADVRSGVTVATVTTQRMEVTFTVASWPGTFADNYFRDGEIEWTTGSNAGTKSPIVSYQHGNRSVQFLLPTPFPIQVGDQGIARPGCDGLLSTCRTKFQNQLNFGGDPFAPSASAVIEPPEEQ